MVDITPIIPNGKQVVEAYGDGGFKISGRKFSGSLIVFPDTTIEWNVKSPSDFSADVFEEVIKHSGDIDILLIGCGKLSVFLTQDLLHHFRSNKIIAEVMDTGAACRTYNVLLSEERKVAAALIAI